MARTFSNCTGNPVRLHLKILASIDSRVVPHNLSSKAFNQELREPKLAYPIRFPPLAQRLPKLITKRSSNTTKQPSRASEPQVLFNQGHIKRKYSDGPDFDTQEQNDAAKKVMSSIYSLTPLAKRPCAFYAQASYGPLQPSAAAWLGFPQEEVVSFPRWFFVFAVKTLSKPFPASQL